MKDIKIRKSFPKDFDPNTKIEKCSCIKFIPMTEMDCFRFLVRKRIESKNS